MNWGTGNGEDSAGDRGRCLGLFLVPESSFLAYDVEVICKDTSFLLA